MYETRIMNQAKIMAIANEKRQINIKINRQLIEEKN